MSNRSHTQQEFANTMRPVVGAAVLLLIGGESLQLISPNMSREERRKCRDMLRDVPEGMVGYGSSIFIVQAEGYYRPVYAHLVDKRCRELFGFGLRMEGDHAVLKRGASKNASESTGFSYYKDEQGRDMIHGDYAYELNKAYMRLIDTPEFVHRNPGGHDYVYVNTAKIYLADLQITAAWCGDEVVITDGYVRIEGAKEKE